MGAERLRTSCTRLCAFWCVLLSLTTAGPAAAQDDTPDVARDGYVEILDVTYEIQPEEQRVVAQRTYTIKNLNPNVYYGDGSYTYYVVSAYPVAFERDITDLVVTANGNPLTIELNEEASEGSFFDEYEITLPYQLRYGNSVSFDVSYALPSYGPEANLASGERRINGALFDVQLITCCYFEEVTSRVVIPADFDVVPPAFHGTRFVEYAEEVADGRRTFTFTDNEIGGDYTEVLVESWKGTNNAANNLTTLPLGVSTLTVSAPPDDRAWNRRIARVATAITHRMERLTGKQWPVELPMTIQQSTVQRADVRRDSVGWHGPLEGTIEVPREFTDEQLAYTLARAWFLDMPIAERWVAEGYTLEFASRAFEMAGLGDWSIRETPGRAPLTSWPPGTAKYRRAHYVMNELADEIGIDGLLEILAIAETDEVAFVGSGDPEDAYVVIGWRRFLDLAERRLGATGVGEIFVTHVLADSQANLAAERDELVIAYEDLFGTGSPAAAASIDAPLGVRTALSSWRLDDARRMLSESGTLLDEREAFFERVGALGLEVDANKIDDSMAAATSAAQLRAISREVAAQQAALDLIETAESDVAASRGALANLGLRGQDLDAQASGARDAFESGDLDLVESRTTAISARLANADSDGLTRLLLWIVLPVAAVLAIVLFVVVARHRKRKKQRARQSELDLTAAALGLDQSVDTREIAVDITRDDMLDVTAATGPASYTGTSSGNPSSS